MLVVNIGCQHIIVLDNACDAAPTWLRDGMHDRRGDHDLVFVNLDRADEYLDFTTLTDHAQRSVFFKW